MKAVIWDWNGTLVNDALILWEVFNELVVEYGGSPISFEEYQEAYRHPVKGMYIDAGVDLSRFTFEAIAEKWHAVYSARSATALLHADAQPTIEALSAAGSRQVVLSALPHQILVESVRAYGIDHHFEAIRGLADALGHSKIEAGVELVSELGFHPEEVTVVGDSSHDAEVAKEIGCRCVLVSRGLESRRRLAVHGFPVLSTFDELLTVASLR